MRPNFKKDMYVIWRSSIYLVLSNEDAIKKGFVGLEYFYPGHEEESEDGYLVLADEVQEISRSRTWDRISKNDAAVKYKLDEYRRVKESALRDAAALNKQNERMKEFLDSKDLCPDCGWVDLCYPDLEKEKIGPCHLKNYFETGEIPKAETLYRCKVAAAGRCDQNSCKRYDKSPISTDYRCMDCRGAMVKMIPISPVDVEPAGFRIGELCIIVSSANKKDGE